jgi:hypothetical protein
MCANCAMQVWETSVRAGSSSGAQAMVAAGLASVGARGVGHWLASRGFAWVTRRRVTFTTAVVVTLALVAVGVGAIGADPIYRPLPE